MSCTETLQPVRLVFHHTQVTLPVRTWHPPAPPAASTDRFLYLKLSSLLVLWCWNRFCKSNIIYCKYSQHIFTDKETKKRHLNRRNWTFSRGLTVTCFCPLLQTRDFTKHFHSFQCKSWVQPNIIRLIHLINWRLSRLWT